VPYLAEGIAAGDAAVVVATASNREAIAAGLRAEGIDMAGLGHRYLALDADGALRAFMDDGRLDPDRFDAVIGGVVRRAVAAGGAVRIYGEMVNMLWSEGAVAEAFELEELWSDLGRRLPISLLCACKLDAADTEIDEVAHLCGLHADVLGPAPVPLGAGLTFEAARSFGAASTEPRAARAFVVGILTRHGLDAMSDDAALIVSELATNSILHGGSAFTVTVSGRGDHVRLAVGDQSSALPSERIPTSLSPTGRGLRLVGALAHDWGTEVLGDAKVVWADLHVERRATSSRGV
jgi:hypothetical protein